MIWVSVRVCPDDEALGGIENGNHHFADAAFGCTGDKAIYFAWPGCLDGSCPFLERKAFQQLFASEDQTEGMQAFIENVDPALPVIKIARLAANQKTKGWKKWI